MAIERALAESAGDVLAAGRLLEMTKSSIYRRIKKLGIRTPTRGGAIAISPDDPVVVTGEPLSRDAYERAAILRALGECDGIIIAAAKLLETGKSTLYRRMGALGIPRHGARTQ